MPRLADRALGDQAARLAVGPGVAAPEADVQPEVAAIRLGAEARVGVGVERQRLLAEHVLAGGERRGHELLVQRRRRGDQDAVDVVAARASARARSRRARRPPRRARRPQARGRRSRAAARAGCAPGRAGAPRPCAPRPRGRGRSPADPLAAAALGLPARAPRRPTARSLTSGTPTCQNAPPSVHGVGRGANRDHVRALGRAGAQRAPPAGRRSQSTRSASQPRARACATQSTSTWLGPMPENMLLNDGAALPDLQALDHGEAAVVAEHRDQLVAGDHRAQQLGVEHQVRAVADEREHLAARARHARAPGAGELVAHAREAVLAVERRDAAREPVDVELAREAAGGRDGVVVRARRGVDGGDDLGVGRLRRTRRGATAARTCSW